MYVYSFYVLNAWKSPCVRQTTNIQLKYNMKIKILQKKSLDPTDIIKHVW